MLVLHLIYLCTISQSVRSSGGEVGLHASGWTGSQKRAIGLRAIARLNIIRKEVKKKKKGKRIGEWIFKDSRYKHTKPQDYKLRLIIDYENFDSFSIKKNVWKVLSFIIFKLHIFFKWWKN